MMRQSSSRLYLLCLVLALGLLAGVHVHSGWEKLSKVGFLPSNSNSPSVSPGFLLPDISADVYLPLRKGIRPSKLVVRSPGFNYFQNLYLFKGAFYFVTDQDLATALAGVPEPGYITTGDYKLPGTHGRETRPGPDRWQNITVAEAQVLFGKVAIQQPGTTIWFNNESVDGPGLKHVDAFLNHYYHCEMFLGAWRVVMASGEGQLPKRIVFRTTADDWRDRAGLVPWFIRSLLPFVEVEEGETVSDRAATGLPFRYDKIVIADRFAAHTFGNQTKFFNKAVADIPAVKVPADWWSHLRDRVVTLSEAYGCSTERAKHNVPVVTYVDRQKTGRRLVPEDHESILAEMKALHDQGVIEFQHGQFENINRVKQHCLAARTDIMLGVHGNGLSHQLWMKEGGGVIEIMFAPGFTRDYAILAELQRHEYYAVHNDTDFPVSKWRQPNGYSVDQVEGFHTHRIRAHGPYIASLVKDMAQRRRGGPTPFDWPVV